MQERTTSWAADLLARMKKMLLDTAWLSMGYASYNRLPTGISFAGGRHPAEVQLLHDTTYVDASGRRHVDQQIFDALFEIIHDARELLILDFFLFNDFKGTVADNARDLCAELTEHLIEQHSACPDLSIYFITDPINTIYGGVENPYIAELASAGIEVVVTDLAPLRDSNPIYSFLWRLLARPFGNSAGHGLLPTPFSDESIPLRSYLALFNLKANHRKSVIADDGCGDWVGMVTTGNPHNGSSAHRNLAVKFNGPAVGDLYTTECAVLRMCGQQEPEHMVVSSLSNAATSLQVVTEKKIKQAVTELLDEAVEGDVINVILFYLSDRQVISRIRAASKRGVTVRLLLDPNKDAFGMPKMGIPNRPVSYDLHNAGVAIRWADTHGEQCHSKLMLAHLKGRASRIILGSANFTRRNLDDFNLETDVIITAPRSHPTMVHANDLFDRLWGNEPGRTYSTDYERYADSRRLRYLLYWLMEKTGLSTF